MRARKTAWFIGMLRCIGEFLLGVSAGMFLTLLILVV
jgi:hypothetical protein